MRRREFVLLAVGAVTAWEPVFAAADTPRIGLIGAGPRQASRNLLDAFRDGLRALGWIDGANLVILDRWAEERAERLPGIAKVLIDAGADILVTAGTPATLAAASVTTTIPIVLVGVADPLAIGIVDSLDRPGGNATGLSLSSSAVIATRLQLLQELVPGLRCVAVIVRNDPSLEQTLLDIRSNARRLGIELVEFEVTTGRTLEFAFMYLQRDRCEAIYVASGPLGPAKRAEVIALAAQARLPVIYSFRIFAFDGGLISYATDDGGLFRRAATYVDQILKGANPGDLPVMQPTSFVLVINLKTAKALGITVPQSILARADEVIE